MKKISLKYTRGLVALVMILSLLAMAATADAASWKQKYQRFSAVCGEALAVGDVACIAAADGKAYLADANDSGLRPAVGVVGKACSSAGTAEIVVEGVITGMTAASPGARLFLSETAGDLTTTGPTNAQPMGWVLPGTAGSSTTYFIKTVIPASDGAAY